VSDSVVIPVTFDLTRCLLCHRAFWRGLGPALILVINPVIQYTVFEQLKNLLIANRTNKMRAAGVATAAAILSDWDFFFLGALSKLGTIPP
jgi:solute carrier family 25 (peroxisomal adenine nucleotide transporter), member 17